MSSILQIPPMIRTDILELKFKDTVKISTLINANFTVTDITDATPYSVEDPFKPIVITRDFYSTPRTLMLFWLNGPVSNKSYKININGLKNAAGFPLDSEDIFFDTSDLVVPVTDITEPTRVPYPTDVEDYTLKDVTAFFPSLPESIPVTSLGSFRIDSIVPTSFDAAYLEPGHREGRIEIYFSQIPAANFISSAYFKVQRKKLIGGISRWENVNAIVTSSPENDLVIIYLPSNDEVPIYGEPDYVYYEKGFKYRLRILPEIGPAY